MLERIKESVYYLKNHINKSIDFAVILGSGLSNFEKKINIKNIFMYKEIPNFPETTVEGHKGCLIFGTLGNKNILLMSGRFHYYEGYSMQQVTFPIRIFHQLGIKKIIISNASGGVNPKFKVGDIMLIRDHINLFPEHPLRGKNNIKFGPRFVDMSEPYDNEFISTALQISKEKNIKLHKGVYLGLQGPTFETPSEYGMVRALGGDVVGMSTIPEIIVAKHQGMRCLAISVIADLGGSEVISSISHEQVLEASSQAIPKISTIIRELIIRV